MILRKMAPWAATCLLLVSNLEAQGLSTITGAFVDIGFGARPLGMGGAFVGLADDVHAVLWNPAGLSQLERSEVSFSYTKQFDLIPYTFAAFGGPIRDLFHHGEALVVSGDATLTEATLLLSVATSEHVLSSNLSVGATVAIRFASFGTNESEFDGQITGDAFGYGLNLGAIYHLSERVSLGLTLNNLFNDLKWRSSGAGSYSQNLPREVIVGVAIKKSENLAVVFDYNVSVNRDTESRLHAGVEKRFLQPFAVRGGLSQSLDFFSGPHYNIGAGFSEDLGETLHFLLDVSYLFHEIGNSFRASLGFRF